MEDGINLGAVCLHFALMMLGVAKKKKTFKRVMRNERGYFPVRPKPIIQTD